MIIPEYAKYMKNCFEIYEMHNHDFELIHHLGNQSSESEKLKRKNTHTHVHKHTRTQTHPHTPAHTLFTFQCLAIEAPRLLRQRWQIPH